ncbi:Rnase Y domain-containing protein [Candidatus Phytoplasma luffae]|uniref:Rnase Y domain-containing protein n=1 Tax=Loofah witches'-broom phytoplasma TaxID=35773 RepID=UPI002484CC22|nr:Rnase Y domain-containing protein [Candidatus Phytoplasma luffae]
MIFNNILLGLSYLCSIFLFLGISIYFMIQKKKIKNKIQKIEEKMAEKILKSQLISAQIIEDAKKKISSLKRETENDLNQRRKIIINLEEKMIHRENLFNKRIEYLNVKEEMIYEKEKGAKDTYLSAN